MARGFTLIEILAVIAIALILFLTSRLFTTNRTLIGLELDRAYDIIVSDLTAAQADATTGRSSSAWGVAFQGNRIIRFQGPNFANRNAAFDIINEVSLQLIITAPAEIVFTQPEGRPVSAATVTINDGQRTRTISVNSLGAISL